MDKDIVTEHANATGRDLARTAAYPASLCREFAKVLVQYEEESLRRPILTAIAEASAQTALHNAQPAGHVGETEDELDIALEEAPEGPPWEEAQGCEAECSEPRHPEGTQSSESRHLEEEDQREQPGNPESEDTWGPTHLEKKLRTIHANLGRPSNQVMVRMLRDAKASPEIIQKAQEFQCPQCAKRGHVQPHRTSQVPCISKKWESVSVDTFEWHSPHKEPKGSPSERVVGISWLGEASDFHTAVIVWTGDKKQGNIKSSEFKDFFGKHCRCLLLKPESIRFDDEGTFRDAGLIEWIEAQAIRLGVIAGEAAWRVGKHSRHLEVLKENMRWLSLEVGLTLKAEELLCLSLAAKNELHSTQGYSPNQRCFGQDKSRVQSCIQNGSHLPTHSHRERETFEESLQRAEAARRTFLQADSRHRILRAARGRDRKNMQFEAGQLVYFYRKGRNNTSGHEAGLHGPARVVAVEKQGGSERSQTVGSVVWSFHATLLYRCAPEQLRLVPEKVCQTYEACYGNPSSLQHFASAGNEANYRDMSQDLADLAYNAEIHDVEHASLEPKP